MSFILSSGSEAGGGTSVFESSDFPHEARPVRLINITEKKSRFRIKFTFFIGTGIHMIEQRNKNGGGQTPPFLWLFFNLKISIVLVLT